MRTLQGVVHVPTEPDHRLDRIVGLQPVPAATTALDVPEQRLVLAVQRGVGDVRSEER